MTNQFPDDFSIEEEYSDLEYYLCELTRILSPYEKDNYTGEGRLKWEVEWLIERLNNKTLAIPLEPQEFATISSLLAKPHFVNEFPDIKKILSKVSQILCGEGLIKPRHTPVVIELIDNFTTIIRESGLDQLLFKAQLMIEEYETIGRGLYENKLVLPVSIKDYHEIKKERLEGYLSDAMPDIFQTQFNLERFIFDGHRPFHRTKLTSSTLPEWIKNW